MSTDVAEVERASDFGSDDMAVTTRWISEIDTAERDPAYQEWLKRTRKIIEIYKAKHAKTSTDKRLQLFWSNIKTLQPAIYAQTPTAVVGRRWKDADPVGRVASEVLERAINYSIDAYAFDDVMKGVRDDELLLARGTAWVRYVPTIEPAPAPNATNNDQGDAEGAKPDTDGQVSDDAVQGEVVSWEEVRIDHVSWEDFLHSPARKWVEVRWVARRAFMTRDELVARFGKEIGNTCPLDWSPKSRDADGDKDEQFKKAAVYEIYDRQAKEAIWICKAYTAGPLDRKPDPLQLEGFFPCPKPVLGTIGPDSLIPVPDYVFYQDQLRAIDELTARIDQLIEALKVRGFYASDQKTDLNTLLRSNNNVLIPVDSWAALAERGGMKGLIEWFPLEVVASTLTGCFEARDKLVQDVFEITGISDIMRGDTDPDETATAAGLKANWGSSRVRDRQKELARFARDCMRLTAEVISNQFDPQTLSAMTDVQLLTAQEKQQFQAIQQGEQMRAQAMAQQAQATGQQPPPPPPSQIPPDKLQLMQLPTWDDVMGLLRNKALRSFHIDIEADSTIEPNDQAEKQRRIEFVQAVGEYLAKSLPVVQATPVMLPVIAEGLKFLVRGFRVGREMEDVIDRAMDQLQQAAAHPQPQQQPRGPDPQAERMKAQAAVMQAQAAQGKNQVEMAKINTEAQLGHADITMEAQKAQLQANTDVHLAHLDQQQAMQQAVEKASQRTLMHEITDTHPMRAPTP